MAIYFTYPTGCSCHRTQGFVRRVLTDVLPTMILLLLKAFAMAMVARFAETSHFTPITSEGIIIE